MKRTIVKTYIVLSLCTFVMGAVAQEFKPAADGGNTDNQAVEPEPVNVEGDTGVQAVQEIQAEADGGEAAHEDSKKTASELIDDFTREMRISKPWDSKRKRMFIKKDIAMNCKNPAFSYDFAELRETLVKRAILEAKGDVIKSIETEMSGADQLRMPGTDIYMELNGAYLEAERKLEIAKSDLEKMLKDMGDAEIEAVEGTTFTDRVFAFMDAAIKKLDPSYSTEKIDDKKRGKYEKIKKLYGEARVSMEQIEKEAERLKGSEISTFSSEVEVYSKMPLAGSTLVYQTESYDEDAGMYEVAVLLCWSAGLEKSARASLIGQPIKNTVKSDKVSINEWIQSQDLSVMVGPRQYVDHEGKRWFLGISARSLGKNAALNNQARKITGLFARQMTAYSLLADVETYEKAKAAAQERGGGLGEASSSKAVVSLEAQLTQGFVNRRVQGIAQIAGKEVIHPVSGRKMIVAVYGMNPDLAEEALSLQGKSYAISAEAGKRSQYLKGARQTLERGGKIDPQVGKAKTGKPAKATPTIREKPKAKTGAFGQKPKKKDLDDF